MWPAYLLIILDAPLTLLLTATDVTYLFINNIKCDSNNIRWGAYLQRHQVGILRLKIHYKICGDYQNLAFQQHLV